MKLQTLGKKKLLSVVVIFAVLLSASYFSYQTGYQEASISPSYQGKTEFHVTVMLQRAGWDEPIFWSHHAGVLTDTGSDFIEGKIGDRAFANGTEYVDYITLSTSASSPAAGWTDIPTEITTNGLARTQGTYASTGVGVWTIALQFTATGTHTAVQLCGFNWDSAANDGSLLWADTFTPVTLENGDKITVTGTHTVT